MRALLDILRDNEAAVHRWSKSQLFLQHASSQLKILDPEHGEEELVKSVAAELAKLMR